MAEPSAMVALGVWPGIRRCARLRDAGRFRGAGAAGLPDDRNGVVVASAVPSSRCMVATVVGTQRHFAAGAAGESPAWFLAVFRGRGSLDIDLRRTFGAVALVADLDPCPVADCNRAVPVVIGTGVAHQSERAAGQFVCGALDQSGGPATGIARDAVVAGAIRG
ncbi:hypothetical protein D3C78_1433320 [compost metagenome]